MKGPRKRRPSTTPRVTATNKMCCLPVISYSYLRLVSMLTRNQLFKNYKCEAIVRFASSAKPGEEPERTLAHSGSFAKLHTRPSATGTRRTNFKAGFPWTSTHNCSAFNFPLVHVSLANSKTLILSFLRVSIDNVCNPKHDLASVMDVR